MKLFVRKMLHTYNGVVVGYITTLLFNILSCNAFLQSRRFPSTTTKPSKLEQNPELLLSFGVVLPEAL